MPSFRGDVLNGQIIFTATVSVGQRDELKRDEVRPIRPGEVHGYDALLDTGSQKTMISQKVISESQLISVGVMEIGGISGEGPGDGKISS